MHFSDLGGCFAPMLACVATIGIELAHNQTDGQSTSLLATELVYNAITALGGKDALESVDSLQYQTARIFRTRTQMQNYGFYVSDTAIATSGNQNVTFSYRPSGGPILQRIDRRWQPSAEWLFASPSLDSRSFSLVVRGGREGYACYREGNNNILLPPDEIQGYTDAGLANYLVLRASKMSPMLMLKVLEDNGTTASTVTIRNGVRMPAVISPALELTVIFDPDTNLPFIIRTIENHALFGLSNRDLQVYKYTTIDGIKFPTRFTTTYLDAMTEDFEVTGISINPDISSDFFDGLFPNNITGNPESPMPQQDYTNAELGVWSDNMLYLGQYTGTLEKLSATHPAPSLDTVWRLVFDDSPLYTQLVVEFTDAVFVFDSPPHQSELVIRWVRQKLGKSVTHLWPQPSHHHHDHAYGAQEFVNSGAKLVVPEVAVQFWSVLPDASIMSYSEKEPFTYRDSKIQLRLVWHEEPAHSADWGYAIVTTACPIADDPLVVFEADIWNPGTPAGTVDQYETRTWLDRAVKDGLTASAIVAPAHGIVANLTDAIDFLEFPYPNLATTDWTFGGPLC